MRKIICITTYPPRECGIATFAQDLIRSIHTKFGNSYSIKVCAVESTSEKHTYTDEVEYTLDTSCVEAYSTLANQLNTDPAIEMVLVQHEFGLFKEHEDAFARLLEALSMPVTLVFHTVLSHPQSELHLYIKRLSNACAAFVVMTQTSLRILQQEYGIDSPKITVIPHGTHLVAHRDKKRLKEKYQVSGRRVLSTFGLLSGGKSIETTLEALPAIIKEHPTVLFLIIGKTHPVVIKAKGEVYREMLQARIKELGLENSVRFVNAYLELPVLLEYLQLTDVYLFTSSDPNQAVSGTFVYALSCGCPIIATPIPHALELLGDNSGVIFDFKNSTQLAIATNKLLANDASCAKMRIAGLQKTAATAWENVAVAYTLLFQQFSKDTDGLTYSFPPIDTGHIRRMSHQGPIIQFSRGNRPDIKTGYTLDDNARALMALCQASAERDCVDCDKYIKGYLDFIRFCQQPEGYFLNYVSKEYLFTAQNKEVLLEDSNGRAICALGFFLSYASHFPAAWKEEAEEVLHKYFPQILRIESPRSMAFVIKGLYYYNKVAPSPEISELIKLLADKLVACYSLSATEEWHWFEAYLTYDNSLLSEALLLAHLVVDQEEYKRIARESFDFLLTKIFVDDRVRVISNQGWLQKGQEAHAYGEQPVDVAGVILALSLFHRVFGEEDYFIKRGQAFNWFLGNNHLHQILYNPVTGGCYDGLEENNINLNQGSESTVCYLMARLAMPD